MKKRFTPKDQTGQTFVEFLLLFLLLVGLSTMFLGGMNQALQQRWVALVLIITNPSPDSGTIRDLVQ